MNKCNINIKEILNRINGILYSAKRKKESIDTIKSSIKEYINEIKDLYSLENISLISETICNAAIKFGVADLDSNFFNENYLNNEIIGIKLGILRTSTIDVGTDRITDTEQVRIRKEATTEFLNNAYGLAIEIRDYVERETKQHIFDACFINRGSLNKPLGIVSNNADLNENIRHYQEILLKKITDYLNHIAKISSKLQLTKSEKEALLNPRLYDDNHNNTGILNTLSSLILTYLTADNFSVDKLRQLHVSANSSLSSEQSRKDKMRLDAYNANVMLTHFDSYLSSVLGKAIIIEDFNQKTGKDKYRIADSTANLAKSWRVSEYTVESEADAITRLAITTTQLYKWGSDTPISERYLYFSDFEHIIGKIKDLSYRSDVMNVKFDLRYIANNKLLWESLSEETKNFLTDKTLSKAINYIRRNPQLYLPSIFELLTNQNFYNSNRTTFFSSKVFTDDELDKLYSISRGIFSPNPIKDQNGNIKSASLFSLSGNTSTNNNYYSYITQTADSIFKISYIQYYRDLDGKIQIRTLIDLSVNNIRRSIELTINTSNSIKFYSDFADYAFKKYNLVRNPGDSISDFEHIKFTLPLSNHDIGVTVNISSGSVIFTNNIDNTLYNNFEELWKENEVRQFIDSILKLGISNNVVLQNALKKETNSGDFGNMCKELLSFSSRVILNLYVSSLYLKDKHGVELIEILEKKYGKGAPKYNYQLDEIGYIHGNDIPILRNIAKAKANISGVTTSALVKDSSGNALGTLTLSRLIGSLLTQRDLQEILPWSATKDTILLTIPGLYRGIHTTKEFYDPSEKSKETVNMTVSEMSYSGIVLDFIGGLVNEEYNGVVGNGIVLFLPSVNSDKNTIGRIAIDLNKQIDLLKYDDYVVRALNKDTDFLSFVKEKNISDKERFSKNTIEKYKEYLKDNKKENKHITKPIKDLNTSLLEYIISLEIGGIYVNMYKAVTEDWSKIDLVIASKGIQAPSLANDFLYGFKSFNEWWIQFTNSEEGENFKKIYGNSPAEFIKSISLEYNKLNQLNPIALIDLVHYKNNKGLLNTNQVFIALIARFLPNFLQSLGFDISTYPTSDQFWKAKKVEMLKSLIESNFRVNTTATTLQELLHIRNNYPEWVNSSGDMILAKVNIDGTPINITSKSSLASLLEQMKKENINDVIDELSNNYELILNPLLELYNYLDYLFTQEFMCTTVGSFIAHPDKSKSDNVIELEASLFNAQHKRNVSFTAAMHAFQLNQLNGIPETYNIAVIDDIEDVQGTIHGKNNKIKPFDGATFVNPFVVILENNSLGPARAGINKKLFVHFKDARTGTGGIIKTAGFGLHNDNIRNSPFYQRMMRKMTDHVWLNEDGSKAIVDITLGYRGTIIYKDFFYKDSNGKIFKIVKIKSLGDNTYQQIVREAKSDGTLIGEEIESPPVVIDTNYKLWNFFGGMNSMTMEGDFLKLSNTSIENVVIAMNNIGIPKGTGEIKTLELLWQPLKHSDIHYVPTAGAVKLGAANINSAKKYHTEGADLDFYKIHVYLAGIQLDKEHHADESDLTLMTLVISACASRGFSFETSTIIYDALRRATDFNTRDHLNAVMEVFESNSDESLQEVLFKSIINNLADSKSNSTNFAAQIASDLRKQAREGKKIKFADAMLPLSDNTVYAKALSAITVYLTKTGIKQKISGILSVLTPSHNIIQLYAGRKYESFADPIADLAKLLSELKPVFDINDPNTNISDIELGRSYRITRVVSPTVEELSAEFMDGQIEQAYKKIIYDRIYAYAPASVRSHITRIINGNIKNPKSLRLIVDKVIEAASSNLLGLELEEFKRNLYLYINSPIVSDNETGQLSDALKNQALANPLLLAKMIMATDEVLQRALSRYTTSPISKEGLLKFANDAGISILPVLKPSVELIKTPSDYHKLKKDIQNNRVTHVIEAYLDDNNKPIGRDLAAYNVRFSTADGRRFQLWDLDSAAALFKYNEILDSDLDNMSKDEAILALADSFFGREFYLDDLGRVETYFRRQLQQDLMNLSKSTPALNRQYNRLLDSRQNTQEWYNRYAQWVNITLGLGNGNELVLPSGRTVVRADNFDVIESQVRQLLAATTKVRINGQMVEINKSTILTQAYELIMPKIFATYFGLKEFDDVYSIKENRNFFVEQYLRNLATQVSEDQYSVELKVSTGDHIYLLNKKQVSRSGLIKVDNILTVEEDGKTYRLDSNGEILYEITPDTEIYVDSLGHEVIVTDELSTYINNLHYDTIKLSSSLRTRPSILNNLLNDLKSSKRKRVKRFYKNITRLGTDINSIFISNNDLHSTITLDNYKSFINIDPNTGEMISTDPIILMGWSKHTSFLKSLDVVAARVPSLCMQSFMPMKVVAFENLDINTAYVSTLLLLLQGSDYDIDAVSLATYDIDRNGILQLWSPYANILSMEMLEASTRLPIPTGLEVQFKEVDSFKPAGKFLSKYASLFNISKVTTFDNNTKQYITSLDLLYFDVNINSVEKLDLLNEFLKEIDGLEIPSAIYYLSFANALISSGIVSDISALHIPSLFENLKRIADAHNMYFDNLSEYNINKVNNNISLHHIYSVISDPVNLILAHSPMDVITGPLKKIAEDPTKSKEAEKAKTRTPGNAINKFESIYENLVGNKGIGICAVSLKTFFGLTQYYNYLLNEGTSKELEKILLGNDHKGIMIGGKTYKTFANIRALDPNTILNDDVLEALSSVTNDIDAAITLSAMLSLAADNAKELALSKLNASTKTLGLYAYGISIGMKFEDLASIMMSDVGRVIDEVANDDVFAGKGGFGSIDDRLFRYFDDGPSRFLLEYNTHIDSKGKKIESPYLVLLNTFNRMTNFNDEKGKKMSFPKALAEYARGNVHISEKIAFFEKLRNEYKTDSEEGRELYNQLIDFVETYILQAHIIGLNEDIYLDIKTLALGAEELRILGLLFGLNKGISSKADELTNQINMIERAIYKHTENLEDLIDLNKFAFDELYRNLCIEKYEGVKHSFNILDAISKVPHFMGYVRTLAVALKEALQSFKFRSASKLSLELSRELKYKKEQSIVKGVLNFIGDYLRLNWMRSKELAFIIPKGNIAFDRNGKSYELTEDTLVRLGTDWGDATFRRWMETEIIPKLKEGEIKPGSRVEKVSSNGFIQDLSNDILTNTVSKNPSIVYTLPINMSPRTDADRAILNKYVAEFNKLDGDLTFGGLGYQYEYTINNEDGTRLTQLSEPIPLVDLFTYYAMIAHGWKLGEKSLVPILDNFSNSGIIKEFHDFESTIDKLKVTLSLKDISLFDILPYVAPFLNPYSAMNATYILYRNPSTRKYLMMEKVEDINDSYDSYDGYDFGGLDVDYEKNTNQINGYLFIEGEEVDTNYFSKGSVQESTQSRIYNFDFGTVIIDYDIESGEVIGLDVNNGLLTKETFPELSHIPTKQVNKVKLIDIELLESIIDNKLNPCE